MPGQAIVQERVVRREEIDHAAVFEEDAADEGLRLGREVIP
jgi:hypothetical protein